MISVHCNGVVFANIQAIVLDKDGTIADVAQFLRTLGHKRSRLIDAQIPGVQDPLLLAFGLNGSRLDAAGLLAVGTRQENEIAAAAYVAETGRSWYAALEIARSAFQEADQSLPRKAEHTPPFPGIADWLRSLADSELKLALLSSDTPANVQDFMAFYHLESLFAIAQGTDKPPAKPDPSPFLAVCHTLGVDPAATLMIGDAEVDAVMAQAAGAAGSIGVTWGWSPPVLLEHADCVTAQWQAITVTAI